MLFCLACGVPAALEILHSSLPKVACLCLVDRVAGLGLAAGSCERGCLVRLGDGCIRNLLLLSSHEAPGAFALLDSTTRLIFLTSLLEFSASPFVAFVRMSRLF